MQRIAIVGRPNVGKSTLFNRLARRRHAITDATPGVTRDSVGTSVEFAGGTVRLLDTGGIGEGETQFRREVSERSRREVGRADVVLLVVDGADFTGEDEELIAFVRRAGRPTVLVVNKIDNESRARAASEFSGFGFARTVFVSAAHGLGIEELEANVAALLRPQDTPPDSAPDSSPQPEESAAPIRLAIVGQPNTGKSSLLNALTTTDTALVSPIAGTTRDVVEESFTAGSQRYVVMDTAGIRRRSRVHEPIEYYSVVRAQGAIERCDVAILVVDATKGLSDQDKKIAGQISDLGRGVVVALNKWDLLEDRRNQFNAIKDRINFLFPVFQHVPIVPISALRGEGLRELLKNVTMIHRELDLRIDTGPLNQAVQRWVESTPPPTDGRRRWKVRYMTQVHSRPVRFVLFCNRREGFPDSYVSYLRNRIRKEFGFHHVPVFIEIRE